MVDPVIICSMRFLQYYYVSGKVQNRKEANLIRTLHFKYNFSEVDIKFMLWRIQDLIYEAAKVASYIVFFFFITKGGGTNLLFRHMFSKTEILDRWRRMHVPAPPSPSSPPHPIRQRYDLIVLFFLQIFPIEILLIIPAADPETQKKRGKKHEICSADFGNPLFASPIGWTLSLDPLLNSY